jgi:hydroxymethylglutaryl-CoA reductase
VRDSRIAGLYRMSVGERIDALAASGWLDPDAARRLKENPALTGLDTAERMIENVIGVFGLPLAVAPNFRVNGRDHLVPMVVEEPSVVAGVSGAAKLARSGGGFTATCEESLLVGQILLAGVEAPQLALEAIRAAADEIVGLANRLQPRLAARGGGARGIECSQLDLPGSHGSILLHLLVDTGDAMGANIVNSMCEGIAPAIEKVASGTAVLKILSNLADRSLVRASVRFSLDALGVRRERAERVRDAVVLAADFADADPHRAATHNKGIMNGVDALAIATGNDWRSIEAGAHAWAAREGRYRSLTRWSVTDGGELAGELLMPLKAGIVGGSLRANPAVNLGLSIAGVHSARELVELMGAVGLAQNFAALRALVTEGIQKGHLRLHARSVAASVGTPPEHFEGVVAGLLESGEVKAWKAEELLRGLQESATREQPGRGEPHGIAAGKVILLGEHAAVYGRHALALPLPGAVGAWAVETEGETRIEWRDESGTRHRSLASSAHGPVAIVSFILERLGLADKKLVIRLASRILPAAGLGASAAAAVAVLRALDHVYELGLDDDAVNAIAFECEKLAHGNPSGIDNRLATYGRPVLFRKSEPPVVRTLDLDESPPLVVAASGTRKMTKEQVQAVARRHERMPDRYNALFDEIDAISVAGADALLRQDYDTLGSLMNLCHGLLNALEVSTPELERMVHIARTNGAVGAKLTGAGGGGSIVALCPGTTAAVEQALRNAGFMIVPTTRSAGN